MGSLGREPQVQEAEARRAPKGRQDGWLANLFLPFLGAALILAAGCASPGPAPPVSVAAGAGAEPWEVPASELGTQRLYRAHYDGPEGDGGSFRLTFRLEGLERYQARGDAVGRKLWTLDVDGSSGLWVDHREEVFCRLEGRLALADSLLAPLPFRSFPALLLGRLPEAPRGEVREVAAGDGDAGRRVEVRYAGGDGRRWRARLEGGRVLAWSLLQDGETVAEWEDRGEEAVLEDRSNGVVLRWRPAVREELAEIPQVVLPPGYRRVECRGLELKVEGGSRRLPGGRGAFDRPPPAP